MWCVRTDVAKDLNFVITRGVVINDQIVWQKRKMKTNTSLKRKQ